MSRWGNGALDCYVIDGRQRQSLVAVRSLGRAGKKVGVVDTSDVRRPPAFSSRFCAAAFLVAGLAGGPDAFVDDLLGLLDRWPASFVIASHDGSIEAIRGRRSEVEERTVLALSDEPSLAVAVDKERTLAVAREIGVPVPVSVPVAGPADVAAAVREVGLPAVVKPLTSWVWGPAGGRRFGSREVLSVADGEAKAATMLGAGVDIALQPWLSGAREAVTVMVVDGRVCARFAQRCYRTDPPLGGASVVRESIELPAGITNHATELVAAIGLEGCSEVEFRRDASGRPMLMEINPRLSASVEVAVRSGVDFPRLIAAWSTGDHLPKDAGYRAGVRMRWLAGDVSWLRDCMRYPDRPDAPARARALGTFVGDFARPAAYDYLDRGDLRPAVVGAWQSATRVGNKVVNRLRAR